MVDQIGRGGSTLEPKGGSKWKIVYEGMVRKGEPGKVRRCEFERGIFKHNWDKNLKTFAPDFVYI
jgi:hypothetical protein